jgi:hypothetical protein
LSRRGSQRPKVAFEGNGKPPNLVGILSSAETTTSWRRRPVGRRLFVVALLVVAAARSSAHPLRSHLTLVRARSGS